MDEEKRLTIQRWLIRAEHDLRSAKNDLKDTPPLTDTACFHTQQCVEKVLKAYHVYQDEHIEKTHHLLKLLEVCMKYDMEFFKLQVIASRLLDYAVTTRYPDDFREIESKEAQEAVQDAEEVMQFVKSKLGF